MKFDNSYYKLPKKFYSESLPARFSKPQLLAFNTELAQELGLNLDDIQEGKLAQIFSGQKILEGSQPIAQAYAAHQFGHFVPQLGDGRALMLGEIVDPKGCRYDIQLKGAGKTQFSRGGDGRSALGPVIREYIVSEAMAALGVPTTRALAAVTTGDQVFRETALPGAVLTRVASSHIRIGTFQYFASRHDKEGLQTLLDYAVARHYPEITENVAQEFLRAVIKRQVSLVTHWMSLGFIHGVMNTDNMTVSGETIDFGPCAFMDQFDFQKVFSSIDSQGRYAYGNQGAILSWNMARLAECLIPLVGLDEDKSIEILKAELATIDNLFLNQLNERMAAKIGLDSENADLVKMFLEYLQKEHLDFTLGFRNLGNSSWFKQTPEFKEFETLWNKRLKEASVDFSKAIQNMNRVNPCFIARNHQVERAIQGALSGDLTVFNEMNLVLKNPFEEQPAFQQYGVEPLPEEVVTATFCGT